MTVEVDSFATVLSSMATAAAVLATIVRSNSKVHRKLQSLDRTITITARDMKRLIVHDDKCTIEERINAGKEYVELGGNGPTEIFLNSLMDSYQAACDDKINGR